MLFLHSIYGTLEFPNCGNLMRANWMENLRWANTEPSMNFRETNTELSMHFRKANTDPSMNFRKVNTELLLLVLLPTILTIYSQLYFSFTPSLNINITTNLLHHVSYIVFFSAAKYLAHSSHSMEHAGKDRHFRMFAPGGHPSKY